MSTRPIARDYKRSRNGGAGFDLGRWKEFAAGLALGLVVALALFVYQRNALDRATRGAVDAPRPEPRRLPAGAAGAAGEDEAAAGEAPASYDFYEMLPKFEVVVPEKEQEVKRDIPASPIERPGVYVLQAGSYRRIEDAQRIQKQLALQGITANVQRVAVDADVWHRVRIGPLTDLDEVNGLRTRLRNAELDALVIRVGD
ncbi:MAG: SPOR domain-containing protein [Steroidobacteraceae bacterium]|jgi:cell division protein FtsN|nr:SPOR domain-containing protein [Steroidobacteraceae bacterium]